MSRTSILLARLCAALMTLALALPATAQGTRHITASLVADAVPATPGGTVTLAIVMKPEPGWHGYWKNPGDAGVETQAAWTLPKGMSAGPLNYPVPQTLLVGGLMNYVYEGDHALLVDLKLPPNVAAGQALPIAVKIDYLVCTKEICVPESAELTTSLVAGAPAGGGLGRWRAAMPRTFTQAVTFAAANASVRIGVPLPADARVENAYFFPLTHKTLDYAAPQVATRDGERLVIETRLADGAIPDKLEGVLRLAPGQGFAVTAVPGTVAPVSQQGGDIIAAVALALGGAILGGLILNIMPCVFPIVSLKALSLARAGGDERAARREAVAYAAGVIATCLALGGIILGARALGTQLGWAFQLQNPAIVLVLLLIATLITLNLAGFLEVRSFGSGQALVERGGVQGAFWTGVLAAFVATPCTGPFMAGALGAALVLPPLAALAVFAGLGFGLALPFLLVGFIPALRRRLPRPGPWMATFQRILAIPMALTVVALLWLIDRSQGAAVFQTALIGVIIIAAIAVVLSRQSGVRAPAWVTATLAVVLVGGAVAIKAPVFASEPSELPVTAFSEPALATARASGKPVFVYFTADWCVTCKVNERGALASASVRTAFETRGTVVLQGDWTDGDPALTRFLNANGAFGVPLYLYYAPGSTTPQVLPQVLTPAMLTSLGG